MKGLYAVTLGQIWLAFGHRIGAVLVTAMVVWLAGMVVLRHRQQRELLLSAWLLVILLVIQIALGVVTVLNRKPADIASAHVAIGALTLVTAFVLAVRTLRLFARSPATYDPAAVGDANVRRASACQRVQHLGSMVLPREAAFERRTFVRS
jgi:cytochrome c oxidase assembly protein subunit 15